MKKNIGNASADLEGAGEIVPIDPVEALCGNLRAVSRCGE